MKGKGDRRFELGVGWRRAWGGGVGAGAQRAAGENVGGLGGGHRRSRPGLTQLNCSKSLRKRFGTCLPCSLPARLPVQRAGAGGLQVRVFRALFTEMAL